MKILWKNKFIFWNLMALVFIKAVFSYSGFQFASLLNGVAVFGKEEVVSQTNLFRQELGLGQLKENSVLDIAAAQKLQDMIQGQYFAHTSPAGTSPWHWIEVNKYVYTYAGENLAIGFLTARDTVNAWANSPSHRDNLLNTHYQDIGVAIAPAKIQNNDGFLVVQLFGTPRPIKSVVATVTLAPSKGSGPLAIPSIKPSLIPTVKPASTEIVFPTTLTTGRSAIEKTSPLEPIVVNTGQSSAFITKASKILNSAFVLYSFIAFLVSIVALAFIELRREHLMRAVASLAILLLAIALPVFNLTQVALIV